MGIVKVLTVAGNKVTKTVSEKTAVENNSCCSERAPLTFLWGGSKGVINFPWIFFLCNAEFSPRWALLEYIRALIHLACLPVLSVTPWIFVY